MRVCGCLKRFKFSSTSFESTNSITEHCIKRTIHCYCEKVCFTSKIREKERERRRERERNRRKYILLLLV